VGLKSIAGKSGLPGPTTCVVADCGGAKGTATIVANVARRHSPVDVSRDRMVAVIAGHNLSKPCTDLGNRLMHSAAQCCRNGMQLRHHAFLRRFPPDDECSVAPALPAVVREAQERKGLRLPFATLLPISGGEPSKLDQSCFLRM
jgi:hypothetical protein